VCVVTFQRLVPEQYLQPIAVQRTRQVAVPGVRRRAVDAVALVDATEQRSMPVAGYRVDQVHESRLLEVQEHHPDRNPYGSSSDPARRVLAARDLGRLAGVQHARIKGQEVFHPDDSRIAHLEQEDEQVQQQYVQPHSQQQHFGRSFNGNGSSSNGFHGTTGGNNTGRNFTRSFHAQSATSADPFGRSQPMPVPASALNEANLGASFAVVQPSLGSSGSALAAPVLRVQAVTPGSKAALAGLLRHDVVLAIHNRPTAGPAAARGLTTLREALATAPRALVLKVKRVASAQTIHITVMP